MEICSEKYLRSEIKYLMDIFCENRHDRKTLQKTINSFEKKRVVATIIITTATLKKQTTTFPWVPKIGPKIKKEIQKFGFRVAFQIGPNLKNISCKNKDKLITNSYPGVYESKCSYVSVYNNESKKKKSLVDQ